MNKNQRTQMQEKQANALALAAAYYKDDLMQISIRLKAFRFHEKALRGEAVSYTHLDVYKRQVQNHNLYYGTSFLRLLLQKALLLFCNSQRELRHPRKYKMP